MENKDRIAPWMKEAAPSNKVQPLTYEQEVHAVLWAAKAAFDSLLQYLQTQAKQEKGDAKKLTLKVIEHEQWNLQRVIDLIPKALERREQTIAAHVPQPTAVNCSTCEANAQGGVRCAECGRRIGPIVP